MKRNWKPWFLQGNKFLLKWKKWIFKNRKRPFFVGRCDNHLRKFSILAHNNTSSRVRRTMILPSDMTNTRKKKLLNRLNTLLSRPSRQKNKIRKNYYSSGTLAYHYQPLPIGIFQRYTEWSVQLIFWNTLFASINKYESNIRMNDVVRRQTNLKLSILNQIVYLVPTP